MQGYQQIQSIPTPMLWVGVSLPMADVSELQVSSFSLVSVFVTQPVNENIVEDAQPDTKLSLAVCVVNTNPNEIATVQFDDDRASFSLFSVIVTTPFNETVSDNDNASFSLLSVIVTTPFNETVSDSDNASFSLLSVSA